MAAHIEYFDDPLNPRGWVAEPARRRLAVAFPAIEWQYRPAGMVESWDAYDGPEVPGGRGAMAATCARLSEQHGMPIDEYLWFDEPPTSSWSACRAIAAAGLQDEPAAGRVLRACREATFIRRQSVSDEATLRAVLEGVPTLDLAAVTAAIDDGRADEAFERHRTAATAVDAEGVSMAGQRVELPALVVRDGDQNRGVSGLWDYAAAASTVTTAIGEEPLDQRPGVEALLEGSAPGEWISPIELAAATGRSEAAVTDRARELVQEGAVEEARFAASPFFRLVVDEEATET